MKKIFRNFIAIALCLTMTVCTVTPSYAAGNSTEYISEIVVENGDQGEARLKDAGYKVLGNLTPGAKEKAFIGYKTTTDPEKAVTDIKVMNMNGKYSYSDYDVMLKKQKAAIEETLDSLAKLIEEYRTNYAAKRQTAIHCYEILNKFYNDDADMQMGDFLLECSLEKNKRDELSDVFLQGNSEIILAIQQALALASDTSNNTFIDRLQSLDYDTLVDNYTEEYGTRKAAITNIALDYDDVATKLLDSWNDFYTYLEKIERDNFVVNADSEEEVQELNAEMDSNEAANHCVDGFIYYYLKGIPYGDATMLDYFCQNSEDMDIEDIYPFVASLSEGQRANAQSITIYTLVEKAVMDILADENTKAAFSDVIKDMPTASVFSGVDRQMFTGGVALTSEATSADSRSSSGGWQKPFEAAEKYYWAIGLITVVSIVTYMATTSRISTIITKLSTQEARNAEGKLLIVFNDVKAQNINAFRAGNFITRRFNYGVGVNKVSGTLVSMHRVSFILSIVAVFVNVAMLSYEISRLMEDEEIEYTNIPCRMVNYISDDDAGHYIKYLCANDLNGKCADLYGFTQKQWLAMYYTTDAQAGQPIKASSLEMLTKNTVPSNKKAVTLFNEGAMYNYGDISDSKASYLAFEQDSASLIGSAFSNATFAIYFGVSLIAAFAVSFAVVMMIKKEKTCKREENQ